MTSSKLPPHDESSDQSVQSTTDNDTPAPTAQTPPSAVLTGKKLAIVFVAMLLSLLLIALDQTILATALPRIASDFDAFSLQGWVATSFLLVQTAFLLLYGQILRVYPSKWVLVSSIAIFEAGSLACALAQNVNVLIAGRTVSGVGAAGIFIALLQIIAQVTRLEDRPRLLGMFGAVFAVASVIGPLMGGAFTDRVTWRWCFYINLPIGGVSVAAVTLLLKTLPPLGSDPTKRSIKDIIQQTLELDFIGATLAAAAVTCVVLALQWGGNTKPWNDKAIIICFVFSGVLTGVFIAWEIYRGDKAMVPTQVFKSRSIYAIIAYCFLSRFSYLLFSYYIPIFYQAVRHASATESGINLIPFMLSVVLTIIGAGQTVGKIGYYWPFLVGAPVLLAVGSGLLFTISPTTTDAQLVGFQILAGVGTGMGLQNSLIAIQTEFKDTPKLIGQATSMASFGQFFGGTIGLGVAEPVLASELSKYLLIYAPDAPADIVKESPTAIYTELSPSMIPGVVHAYTLALRIVFVIGVPVAGLALFAAMFIKNIRIVKSAPPAAAAADSPKPAEGDVEKGERSENA
jgi:MFS family permease